jgi:hypothetical protein
MLDVFNIATPQGCNIQTFYGTGTTNTRNGYSWNKPRGVSHVYILLIGAGGNGDGSSTGGGSGAVTVWYGAAQNVPDFLIVKPSQIQQTVIQATFGTGGYIEILSAPIAGGTGTAVAMSANFFTASGFFQSVGGQAGTTGAVSASGTTFLSGGAASGGVVTGNYGYSTNIGNASGFFQLQPIIVGVGGSNTGRGGIGCGGGVTGVGGPGMALIASW